MKLIKRCPKIKQKHIDSREKIQIFMTEPDSIKSIELTEGEEGRYRESSNFKK